MAQVLALVTLALLIGLSLGRATAQTEDTDLQDVATKVVVAAESGDLESLAENMSEEFMYSFASRYARSMTGAIIWRSSNVNSGLARAWR